MSLLMDLHNTINNVSDGALSLRPEAVWTQRLAGRLEEVKAPAKDWLYWALFRSEWGAHLFNMRHFISGDTVWGEFIPWWQRGGLEFELGLAKDAFRDHTNSCRMYPSLHLAKAPESVQDPEVVTKAWMELQLFPGLVTAAEGYDLYQPFQAVNR